MIPGLLGTFSEKSALKNIFNSKKKNFVKLFVSVLKLILAYYYLYFKQF
jgi:hypothetical protein